MERLTSLVSAKTKRICCSLDINDKRDEDVYRAVKSSLSNRFEVKEIKKGIFEINGSRIIVIALGLMGDEQISSLGVKEHELEDYLLKILFQDDNLVDFLSHLDIKDSSVLERCLKEGINTLKKDCTEFHSSKSLLDVAKALINFRASPTEMARNIVSKANEKILINVARDII